LAEGLTKKGGENMTSRKHLSFLTIGLFAFLTLTPFLVTASNSIQRESFRGLDGVFVSVERLDPRIEENDLTAHQIRADVVSQVRKAGIRILSKKEWFDTEGSPYFYVNANILKLPETEEYVYSVNISLKQTVYPARNPVEIPGAATWSIGGTVGITPNLRTIRDAVRAQVKEFIKVYLSVNPK
jgi:hypothetical protein